MRNVMLIALLPAFLLAAGMTHPMTAIDQDPGRFSDNEPVIRVDRPSPEGELMVQVGIIDTVGGTTCDWQFNGPMGRYLLHSSGHGLHAGWMYSASDQTTYPDRNMRYNYFDYGAGEWLFSVPGDYMSSGLNAFTDRAGYGTLEADPSSGVAYVSSHVASTTPGKLKPILARDMDPGSGLFEYCDAQQNADAYLWPYMSVDSRSAVHFALIDDVGERDNVFYSKVDPWCQWSVPVGVAGMQPNPGFPTQNIAASKVSQKVTIAWEFSAGAPDPAFYRSSPDGGATWGDPTELIPPAAYRGDTTTSYHITSMFPFYDSNDQLHMVVALMPYVAGQGFIIPAQLWHWSPSNSPEWNHIHTAEPVDSLLAPVGYNALFACRVNIGEGTDGKLFVTWEEFKEDNVEPQGDFLRADIFVAGSRDNGKTWGDPLMLTVPDNTTKRFPSIADHTVMVNGEEHVAVLYIIDQIAGFHVQGQGPATNNPTIVHWVPTSAIGVAEPGQGVKPVQLELAARPNPFGNRTSISYAVPRAGNVSLAVYDAAGRPVRTLVNARQTAGRYNVNWNGRDDLGSEVAAGIYFYKLTTDQGARTAKLTVVR